MATPGAKLYEMRNRARTKPLDFEETMTCLQKIEGAKNCRIFDLNNRSLHAHSLKHIHNGEGHFIDGFLKYGSYGMHQAHHDVKKEGDEEEIPSEHATTKEFYFMLYDNSQNKKSSKPYIFATQLWGRENPYSCVKKFFSRDLHYCMNPLVNRKHLTKMLESGRGNEMILKFTTTPEYKDEIPSEEPCIITLRGKGKGLTEIFKDKLASMLKKDDYENFLEICEEEVATRFNYTEGDLDEVSFKVLTAAGEKTVSYSKLSQGLQEKYCLKALFKDNVQPDRGDLRKEFLEIIRTSL